MPRFRKKPIEIDALQLTWANWNEICDFVGVHQDGPVGCYLDEKGEPQERPGVTDRMGLIIPTLEGRHIASENDWIIKGINGEFYPCKPDIFVKTYDPVIDPV